jgi:dipeptidyl aminopeptidase/acylaminoacyl peptidase
MVRCASITGIAPRRKAQFLFTNRKALEGLALAPMQPVVIKSRDGKDLVSYLTLPAGSAKDATHRAASRCRWCCSFTAGPGAATRGATTPIHQLLRNRGYAVLSVNFRASTGFGKEFVNAGNASGRARCTTDLLDAVDWAVKRRSRQPDRVAIMGGSYGGYATLVGLTQTPDVFACGVDIVGPSELVTLCRPFRPTGRRWSNVEDARRRLHHDPRARRS